MTALPDVLEKLERATPGPWSYCGQSGGHACTCGLVWGAGDHSPAVAEFSLADEEYEGHRPATEERQFNTEAAVMAVNWLREHGPALLRDAGDGWRSISEAPHNRKLLAGYRNSAGNWRNVTAIYYPENRLEMDETANWDDSDDEYAPAGWYETSETHEVIHLCEEVPTHWRPLPKPPAMHAPGGATE